MSVKGAPPPERVPTLTEVVAWPESTAAPRRATPIGALPTEADLSDARPLPVLRMPEDQMLQSVLAEVLRQVELVLEHRLREVLTPLLNRATDHLVRDARRELASTLRELVAHAVAQELSRHRAP